MRLFKYKIWSQHLSVFLDLNILRKYVFRVFSRVFSYLKVKTLENDYRSKYSYLLKFDIGTLLRKVNGSSSFCKGPRTSKV